MRCFTADQMYGRILYMTCDLRSGDRDEWIKAVRDGICYTLKKKWRFRMWNPEFIVISCRSTIFNFFGPRCCKGWIPVCILCQFFSFVKRKCLNYSKFALTFEKFIYFFLKLYELYSCKLNIMLKGFLENIIGKKN